MLTVKKMKPKKGKKKSLPKEEDETIQSSPESPPESQQMGSLQQLFDARNVSKKKRKKDRVPEDAEDTVKPKKPKTREAPKDNSPKKEKADFPRGKAERQEQRQRTKEVKLRNKGEETRLGKTLFVGNLPRTTSRKHLEKMFSKFGKLESVRLRGAIPVKTKISKRVADITHKFHEGLHSRKGFVVFKLAESADAALTLNGTLIEGHHIIVDRASGFGQKKTYDEKRTVFLGNLPFNVDDEVVWNALSSFGEVEAVRVVRDKMTGAGKGFGYVLFKTPSSIEAALGKEQVEIEGRKVRIKPLEGTGKGTKEKNKSGYGLSLKAKNRTENPQSRKSAKKLLKREKTKHQKQKVAHNFKQFF